ncbi:MAG: polysaccharide deacetylase family protein [Rhodanobacter sp.]
MKKAIASHLLCRSGLRRLLHRTVRWSGVLALNYHRIGDALATPFDRGLWSASAEAFAEQVRFCKTQLEIIGPADLPRVRAAGRGRYAMITFDDGYRDNYQTALPILRGEGVAATFFVATGFIDAPTLPWWDEIAWMARTSRRDALELPAWFDAPIRFDEPERETAVRRLLRRYKEMPAQDTAAYLDAVADAAGTGRADARAGEALWMTWDMLREMRAAGMTIGGHTVHHPVLSRMSAQGQRHEILECGRRLAAELGTPMRCFSYPVGNPGAFDQTTRDCLREAGVEHAFSYYGGYAGFDHWDAYDIPRVAVETELDTDWFRCLVTLPRLFA